MSGQQTKSDKHLLLQQINEAESIISRNLDASEVTRLVEGMGLYTNVSDEGEYTEVEKLRIIATAAFKAGQHQAQSVQGNEAEILAAAKELGRVEVLNAVLELGAIGTPGGDVTWMDSELNIMTDTRAGFLAYLDSRGEGS